MNKLVKLFSHAVTHTFNNNKKKIRTIWVATLVVTLVACGGGSSDSEKGLLVIETPVADPTIEPSPTATPVAETPPPGPTQTPDPTPTPTFGELLTPSLNVTSDAGVLTVNWNDAGAQSYRVLFWGPNEVDPMESFTTQLQFSTFLDVDGQYSVIVEAYDELGNSLFSEPSFVEVSL